ncbi:MULTISPECIES: ribosome recycling factor [unclassified Sulfuricurvum]|uniref:ribosome recycling factor n=1 Tax=unclassified Sulfuricurvum TaxID=2632390 RepID=UPI00029961F2|nr:MULTISPECIES: ribosome recycling factor [unclassified Sulfuricurvum]OHD84880.1 MAG: ribosome recycling factor [Sulfuricurvum sp. RIFCSPHIGHO2_02_FULL_43_9]OHD86104.1 MAG: ribosome recycling factor [Sulfuricurvum sp. RIFCSPLOWO2_02_FULL_43_45]OHD86936.1 MAG: ribosome recycling factor [Sulfuricurvum sp. RIFCSPLOWO2_02_43_6]AFV98636.1 ribosome recycling factor [Candidatus Sulfuricurvum sp. RIFRC-1]OHD89565.1 MAG: ribosome recycling factor [Sulfuricurvum sp. RIFCSPLOWO2_12_FULL_43_24]
MLNEVYQFCEEKMQGSCEHLLSNFRTLRTGRVTTKILDNVRVDNYGSLTPIDQAASVLATDATTITISPWDKSMLSVIEKAIMKADIGVNPNNNGTDIKLFFPAMTVDQRHDTAKKARGMAEDAKVAVRNDRKKANDKIKVLEKDKLVTADESKGAQDKVQKITDKFIAKIEELLKSKEQDILTV